MPAKTEFLFGIEQECLTVAAPTGPIPFRALLDELSKLAPSLPGPSGLFNAYGRVYLDGGLHLEVATAECDSPYQLPTVLEQQFTLIGRAIARLPPAQRGIVLAANNHAGLLHPDSPTWGTHENYLVEVSPRLFGDRILPFLVSRVYAGAGGVLSPTGQFVSGVRSVFMKTDQGGDTTAVRAIHSTAREEAHCGGAPGRYRYHLILGDGLRSHFGIALRAGATALALKAIFHDPDRIRKLTLSPGASHRVWLEALRRLNALAEPGAPPRAHPLALRIQWVYLDAARAFVDATRGLPDWVERTLADWETTLWKIEQNDCPWLAARLDPWIKYELYSAWLGEGGHPWADLRARPHLRDGLALLDQRYHDLICAGSPFARLEAADALRHRVASPLLPGEENEPFVPSTRTRARLRARLLKQHGGHPALVMNWCDVVDRANRRRKLLTGPLAQASGPWQPWPATGQPSG